MALSPRDRRALIALGAAAGIALLAFVYLNVLRGGGGEEPSPPPISTGGPTPAPTVSPTPTPRETLPPVVLAGARDPFSIPPVLQTGTPPPGGGVAPPPTGTVTVPPPTGTGTAPPPGTGTPTPTPTTPGGGQSTTIGGHTVVLIDIFQDGTKVQVEVDGTVFTVSLGERFDGNFRLVSISGNCARFVFGDEGFTLCTSPRK
jgi:hypothetical protein